MVYDRNWWKEHGQKIWGTSFWYSDPKLQDEISFGGLTFHPHPAEGEGCENCFFLKILGNYPNEDNPCLFVACGPDNRTDGQRVIWKPDQEGVGAQKRLDTYHTFKNLKLKKGRK